MNIENKYPVMIFRRENQGHTFYSIGISRKDRNGNYINGYIDCRFKKGIELENQTKIYIKKAWLDFYLKQIPNTQSSETKHYIFISEFETINQTIDRIHKENEVEEDPYKNFGMEITPVDMDNDLPF